MFNPTTFQNIADAYISNTSFIYASKQANQYVKSLVNDIDFSPYAINPNKYNQTRKQIYYFLCDTINQTLYAFKQHRESQGVWRRKLPLSNKELRKKWSLLLDNNRYTKRLQGKNMKVRRGLDVLLDLNIIKNHGYKPGVYCSSFSINPDILSKIMVLAKRITVNSILEEEHIDYETGEVYSINSILANNTTTKIKPRGLILSNNSKNNREYKKIIDKVLLKNRNPVRVNIKQLISGMLQYVNDINLPISTRLAYLVQCKSCVFTILRNGFLSIKQARSTYNNIHYKVAYYPIYKLAEIGGRIFEVGGGIQFLKSSVRSTCRSGLDYDLSSSQLTILKDLCKHYKIPFKDVDLSDIAKEATKHLALAKYKVTISKDMLKPILYGVLFGAGYFSKQAFSQLKESLKNLCNITDKAFIKLSKFLRSRLSCIAEAVKSLVAKFMADSKYWTKQGTSTYLCKNTLGLSFKTHKNRYDYCGNLARQVEREDQRKILAHIIQGIEMSKIIKIVKDTGIIPSSIEHDGLLVDHYVNKAQAQYCEANNFIVKH